MMILIIRKKKQKAFQKFKFAQGTEMVLKGTENQRK